MVQLFNSSFYTAVISTRGAKTHKSTRKLPLDDSERLFIITIGRLLEIETEYETHYTETKIGLKFLAHFIVFHTQSQFGGVVLMLLYNFHHQPNFFSPINPLLIRFKSTTEKCHWFKPTMYKFSKESVDNRSLGQQRLTVTVCPLRGNAANSSVLLTW